MTHQEAKELLPLITAFSEGKKIRRKSDQCILHSPGFSLPPSEYEIVPEPRTVPWDSPEDVPLNCWIRSGPTHRFAVVYAGECGVNIGGTAARNIQFGELFNGWEYSTDGKTWKPCQKEVL